MTFSKTLQQHLEQELHIHIQQIAPLSGGDINQVFKITTTDGLHFVIKLNSAKVFHRMFAAEAIGLKTLAKTQAFKTPKVISHGEFANQSYLILEYIHSGSMGKSFWLNFGKQLARLHKTTNLYFGLETHNYIGSLPQYNTKTENLPSFYIEQRLEPQFKLASKKGYSFTINSFYKNLEQIIPNEQPALIHGDLWSGNYLVDENGYPALIDPAICFGSREMDIAMMHLFGGFSSKVFDYYHQSFPLIEEWKRRLSIWQLYYLLVHLNLFGSSYYASVSNIIKQFS
ncbi:fructosamine kinase family protein [Zhouia sp. PK063]|uniref:fructosamine kinase family protein n=1 Tax=Zhouia sp. PK063 TaxID=3373602 RepID=UPI00379F02C9